MLYNNAEKLEKDNLGLYNLVYQSAFGQDENGNTTFNYDKFQNLVITNFGDVKKILTNWYKEDSKKLEIANDVRTIKENIHTLEEESGKPIVLKSDLFGISKGFQGKPFAERVQTASSTFPFRCFQDNS